MKPFKKIAIKFDCGFHCGSGYGISGYIDQLVNKDPNGIAFIPASTLKGKFRWASKIILNHLLSFEQTKQNDLTRALGSYTNTNEQICTARVQSPEHTESSASTRIRRDGAPNEQVSNASCDQTDPKDRCVICRLFGNTFHPGLLIFEDAYPSQDNQASIQQIRNLLSAPLNPFQNKDRFQVSINRKNNVAMPKHLLHYEMTLDRFDYSATLYVDNDDAMGHVNRDIELLKACTHFITHLGGKTAAGLGRCTLEIGEPE
jgi:CRISPR/Cas system CSM-associated protein Csm3 (group 7 of RAMP superfamily)